MQATIRNTRKTAVWRKLLNFVWMFSWALLTQSFDAQDQAMDGWRVLSKSHAVLPSAVGFGVASIGSACRSDGCWNFRIELMDFFFCALVDFNCDHLWRKHPVCLNLTGRSRWGRRIQESMRVTLFRRQREEEDWSWCARQHSRPSSTVEEFSFQHGPCGRSPGELGKRSSGLGTTLGCQSVPLLPAFRFPFLYFREVATSHHLASGSPHDKLEIVIRASQSFAWPARCCVESRLRPHPTSTSAPVAETFESSPNSLKCLT